MTLFEGFPPWPGSRALASSHNERSFKSAKRAADHTELSKTDSSKALLEKGDDRQLDRLGIGLDHGRTWRHAMQKIMGRHDPRERENAWRS